MSIIAKSIEQDYQNGQTRVWFEVDGEQFCVADSCGDKSILDCDGYPLDDSELEGLLYPKYDLMAKEYCGEDRFIDEEL